MNQENPPDSWYDPPMQSHDYEIKEERYADPDEVCERDNCYEDAGMRALVGSNRSFGGEWRLVCKGHYESIIEDTIEDVENYEPDYEEED